ncbi:MAG: response regulator [Bacillota bacterium]|nr:response regulator [Bacillota bacterium]
MYLKTVLVIDDSPFVYKAIRRALEPHGFDIVGHAQNGHRGLEMIATLRPDIITLDVTMLIMDGLQVAARLPKSTAARTIMLSAMGDMDLIKQVQNHGIKHFLSKPFQPDDLVNQIREIQRETAK